jgi:signal transduction histidine kinase
MTPGTSPHPRGTPSMLWTVAEHIRSAHARLAMWTRWLSNGAVAGPPIARLASVLYLAALAVLAMTAWHDPTQTASGFIGGLPAWHLAFLMATGTGVALLTLTGPQVAAGEAYESEPTSARSAGLSELMAQMSHELRTPLNAVIGFSELMLRELHGPLGNARYQEYAHHISESGGRLLKSSEDALAVTEAMTALMTDRGSAKRERRIAATLVRDAWRIATSASQSTVPRLVVNTCTTCDLTCEQRPTAQAFEHLFGEALVRAGADGAVTVTGRRQARNRSVEIRVERGAAPLQQRDDSAAHASLRIILARLLLEMQGASVLCSATSEAWVARVDFPGRA